MVIGRAEGVEGWRCSEAVVVCRHGGFCIGRQRPIKHSQSCSDSNRRCNERERRT
jgi:hypothetical protein